MKRNSSISLRKPESTSIARLNGFTKNAVTEFNNNLQSVYRKYSLLPKDIYNLDETGISTVLENPKVIAEKGKRLVSQVSSAERGTLVTMIGIINASGNHLPPIYIFPRKRENPKFMKDALTGSIGLLSKSGWMIAELFVRVLQHIKHHTNCSRENPILLLLDNHSSHCSLDAIIFARESGIILLTFPPHTSHRLQPLDVAIYGPFKKFCKTAYHDFLINNPGEIIRITDIASLTKHPFIRAFSTENILKGFSCTGICPFNQFAFTEEDFAVENEGDVEESLPVTPSSETPSTNERPQSREISQIPSTSAWHSEVNQHTPEKVSPEPIISPEVLRPLVKMPLRKSTKGKKTIGKSRIFTETPEKERVQALAEAKKTKLKCQKITKHKSKVTRKIKKRTVDESSTESDELNFSLADSDKSMGMFSIGDSAVGDDEDNHLQNFRLCDSDSLAIGDYVLVKFFDKKDFYFAGQIVADHSDEGISSFTVKFLRKQINSWTFYEPLIEDSSFVLRTDIFLRPPQPDHPAGTSRSRTKAIFNINLTDLNVK